MPRPVKSRTTSNRALSRRELYSMAQSAARPSERAAQRQGKNAKTRAASAKSPLAGAAAARVSDRLPREAPQSAKVAGGEKATAAMPYEDVMVEPDDQRSKTPPRFVAQTAGWAWGEGEQAFRANNYPLADWAFFSAWRVGAPAASFDIGQDASAGARVFEGDGYLDYLVALVPEGADLEKWKEALRRVATGATKAHERSLVDWAQKQGGAAKPGMEVAVALWRLKNERWAFGLIASECDFDEDALLGILEEEGLEEPDFQDPGWVISASEHTLGDDVTEDNTVHPLTREMQAIFGWKKWRHAEAERKIIEAETPPGAPGGGAPSRRL